MPIDFCIFTSDGILHTDVTNPILELLVFGVNDE
jgi:hypothetical protein